MRQRSRTARPCTPCPAGDTGGDRAARTGDVPVTTTSLTEDLDHGGLSTGEFVALIALSMSLVAMSIDSMLPALPAIAGELGASGPNDRQLVLTIFFAGMTIGQLVFGPLSDSVGRKRALYAGIALYV